MKRVLNKRVVLFSLILFIFAISIVMISAAPIDTLRELFNSITSVSVPNFQLYSAQFLLLILVTLIIFAVSDFIPFLEGANIWLRLAISLIIGILSVAYLAPEEVYTALMSYQALGIVLSTLVPLAVLLVVTIRWNTRYPQYSFLSTIAWIAYLVAYFIKFYEDFFAWFYGNAGPHNIGAFGFFFVGLTGLISLAMAIFGGYISRWVFRRELRGLEIRGELNTEEDIVAEENRLRAYLRDTPQLANEINARLDTLRAARKKMRAGTV